MRIVRQIAHSLRKTDGAEIAEAALVLPLVFMLLLGVVWFGRAFNIYSTIQQAAQQGAITAARSTCVTCGNNGALDGAVDNAITNVMQASNLDPNQIQTPANPGLLVCPAPAPPGGGCALKAHGVYVCRNVQLNASVGATQTPQCGTVVSFQYPFQFHVPFGSLNHVVMSAQAQSRMEN